MDLIKMLQNFFCREYKDDLNTAFNEIFKAHNDIKQLRDDNNKLKATISKLKVKVNPNEDKTNNKYPKANIKYTRIETDGEYEIDVRQFLNPHNYMLPTINGKTDDEKALKSLQFVMNNIHYTDDKKSYGYDEYWAYDYQTLKRRVGDCEDGAILLANIMVKNGIPYWKVRMSAGLVNYKNKTAGHAYITYYVESKDKWVLLDWCYYPDKYTKVEHRSDYKNNRLYKNVWFSFNTKFAFAKGTKVKL